MSEKTTEPDGEEVQLSPSETMAHDAAMRVAGAANGTAEPRTQRALASITLGFELIVVVLIGLAIFGLGLLVPRELGLWIAGGLAALCIVALGLMRFGKWGIALGWVVHLSMFAVAFIMPMALVVALMFTALWVFCLVKGQQIDRDRARWSTQYEG